MQRTLFPLVILLLITTSAPSHANDLPPTHAPHWLSIDRQFGFGFEFQQPYQGEVFVCGFGSDLFPFQSLKFLPATNSTAHTDPTLPQTQWQAIRAAASTNTIANKAIIRRVDGSGELLDKDSPKRKATVGRVAKERAVLTTDPDSYIDLFLGDNGPILRLTPDTEIEIARLDLDNTGLEKIIDTRIDLRRGRIQGNVKKLASASSYLIRTRSNLIRIRGTEFQIDADGTCAIVTGIAEITTPTHRITVNAGEIFTPAANNPK